MGLFNRKPEHTPVAAQAYLVIRRRILELSFKPGDLLSETRLAVEFGLSRTPVREALKRLEGEGLVDVVPQHGTFVSPIRPDLVRTAQYAREALEAALVRDAAERSNATTSAELYGNLAAQRAAVDDRDFEKLYELDEDMHRLIARIGEQEAIWDLVAEIKIHMDRARKLTLRPDHAPTIIEQHRAIIDAIAKRDATEAVAAMRVHLRFVIEHMDDLAARYPEFLEDRKPRLAISG